MVLLFIGTDPKVLVFFLDWSRGLILPPLLLELEFSRRTTPGIEGCLESDVVKLDALRTGGPGSLPNFGNSNWKFTSLGLLTVLLLAAPLAR